MDWSFPTTAWPETPRCRLLELPAELRDLIYDFALTSPKPLVTFHLDAYQKDSYTHATQPPLTRVSRQLRYETLPIYYSSNAFVLHTEGAKAEDAQHWLQCIEPHIPKLWRIELWVRYVMYINTRSSVAQGMLRVAMTRDLTGDGGWRVDDEWKWITVVRRPAALEGDAEFLIRKLRMLLAQDSPSHLSAEGLRCLLSDLPMAYVKHKNRRGNE